MNKNDKRYVKNHQLILDTFSKLLAVNKVKEITVNQICEKALVSKTTFYDHFNNKEELLLEIENNLLNPISEFYQSGIKKDTLIDTTEEILQWTVEFVKRNNEWFKNLFVNDFDINFSGKLTYKITQQLTRSYNEKRNVDDPIAYTALLYGTNGLVVLIKNWSLGNINEDQLWIIFRQIHEDVCRKINELNTKK